MKYGSSGGLGRMQFVGEETISGAATSGIEFTGLNLDSVGMYFMEYTITNPTGGALDYLIKMENDAVAANYRRQTILADGAAISASIANDNVLSNVLAGDECISQLWVKRDVSGYIRYNSLLNTGDAADMSQLNIFGTYEVNTNLTRLGIDVSGGGNGIGISSNFRLFKLVRA